MNTKVVQIFVKISKILYANIKPLEYNNIPQYLTPTMYHNTTVIGLMDEAYFVPRHQIITWINQSLKLNIQAIEDLGSGSVYCQLLDYGFGQRVSMQKVNWKAKFDYEFIANFKIFQNTLEKLGIVRKIEIEKLAKAKYQDNLELIQWLKRYIELNGNVNDSYPAQERRNHAQLYLLSQEKKVLGNSFKTNTPSLNSSLLLNQSICSTISKPRPSFNSKTISNKENELSHTKKPSTQKLSQQMNQIKKVLNTNVSSDQKISDIHKIVYGFEKAPLHQNTNINNLMEIEAVVSDDEEMVF